MPFTFKAESPASRSDSLLLTHLTMSGLYADGTLLSGPLQKHLHVPYRFRVSTTL